METYHVPKLFDDSSFDILKAEGVTIVAYHQDEEIEKVNARLSHNLIVFVLSGYKEVLGKQQNIAINDGEGFFLCKGNYLLSEKFGDQQHYRSYLFFFSDEFAHQFSRNHPELTKQPAESPSTLSTFSAEAPIYKYIDSLKPYLSGKSFGQSSDIAELKMQELFLLLLHSGNNDSFKEFLRQLSTKPANKLREIMNVHYKENLSLEQLAFLADCSLSTFKRRFKKEFNTTPAKWIKQKRLEEAKFLLRSSQKNVSEICLEVGFENLSHFIQSFKEHNGTTPKQFQLEHADT